tara:strand:+ start:306 stop:1142 length:837 start_codon:yes stop_codon:yes gene_type:complete
MKNQNRTVIVVGKDGTDKMEKASKLVSNDPIIMYANEYDIEDNHSIPADRGIIIRECNYKPNVDVIRKTILEYKGQVVLTSINQKDVPKKLFSMCKLNRASKHSMFDEIKEIAPRSDEPYNYDVDIFTMVGDYLRNPDREVIMNQLKISEPADVQFISWLAPNLHPNKLMFLDAKVKRRWDKSYFYEMLAYAHDGRMHRKMTPPQRKAYSSIPKILRKLKMRPFQKYLLKDLLKNNDFKEHCIKTLSTTDLRVLKLRKSRQTKRTPVQPVATLSKWLD